ncbi:MAG: hypothetical protein WED08_00445, partial [Patescibacteria group bacterium]
DLQDATITFDRGTESPNAVLRWDSTADQYRFESFPVYLDAQLISGVSTGTAPFSISSTTKVDNLNVDLFDDLDSASFLRSDTDDSFTSGTLTFGAGTTLDVSAGALTLAVDQISWDRVSKVGSSLVDLATRSAGDLSSGNLDVARLPTGGNWDLSTDLTVEATTLFIGATGGTYSGLVGIGTTTPTSKFQIGTDTVVQQWSGSTPYVLIQGVDNEVATPAFTVKDENLGTMFELTTTGDSTVGRAYFGGNVGIGTTGPGAKLEVSASSATPAFSVSQSGSGYIVEFKDGSDQVFYIEDGGAITIGDTSQTGANWSISHDGTQSNILSLAVYDGKLYAGQGSGTGSGDVLVFNGASWSISHDGAQEGIASLAVYDGKLYAGQGIGAGDGDVLVFNGASWSISHDGA